MQSRKLWLPAAAISLLALDNCSAEPGADPTCGTASFDIAGNRVATFGTSADAAKIKAFLQATLDLSAGVNETYNGLLQSCQALGTDLGIAASEYRPMSAGELEVTYTCRRVATEIQTILRGSLSASARLQLAITPAVCRVDINAQAACYAECTLTPGMVTLPTCSGTVVADCSGSCDAVCQGSCSGGCTGQCSGTCMGSCSGTCNGQCSAGCSQMDATGRCIGTCTGMCTGSCSAGCTGQCMGSCTAGCMGTCMGQCRGMCSVASNVRCEGTLQVERPMVECDGACRARFQARAECTPPRVVVTLAAGAMINAQNRARVETLITSLQTRYPEFLRWTQRLTLLGTQTVPTFVGSVQGAAGAAANVSTTAVACTIRAGVLAAEALTRFNATLQVTVSVQASVTTQGG